MNEINQILIPLSVVLYMLISCVFDAFEDLSGGRVRKIEEKNPELAEKLDSWLEKDDQIRMLFKLLLFVIASVFSISVYCSTIHLKSLFGLEIPYLGVILLAVSIVLLCSVSDLLAKLLLPRGDLLIIPGDSGTAGTAVPPAEQKDEEDHGGCAGTRGQGQSRG